MASPPRAALVARSVVARIRVVLVSVVAVVGAMTSLVPLALRRKPRGHRTHLPRPVARVIPLVPKRQHRSG